MRSSSCRLTRCRYSGQVPPGAVGTTGPSPGGATSSRKRVRGEGCVYDHVDSAVPARRARRRAAGAVKAMACRCMRYGSPPSVNLSSHHPLSSSGLNRVSSLSQAAVSVPAGLRSTPSVWPYREHRTPDQDGDAAHAVCHAFPMLLAFMISRGRWILDTTLETMASMSKGFCGSMISTVPPSVCVSPGTAGTADSCAMQRRSNGRCRNGS
mmetsp:Transcript_12293/g.30045  ORF Transcript_12293/g.30045 Transcript_12293/m.30045 type:complete len:210 (-) Transcript_12293:72-701(-)